VSDRLAEIEARWRAAQLGPWNLAHVEEEGFPCIPHPHWDIYREIADHEEIVNEPGRFEARVDLSKPPRCVSVGCYLGDASEAQAIAASREDVRWLIAEVRRLRAPRG
jgi:hypothetical protein